MHKSARWVALGSMFLLVACGEATLRGEDPSGIGGSAGVIAAGGSNGTAGADGVGGSTGTGGNASGNAGTGGSAGTGGGAGTISSDFDVPIANLHGCTSSSDTNCTLFLQNDADDFTAHFYRENAQSGGGWVQFLGGEVYGGYRPGDGICAYSDCTNVVWDTSAIALSAYPGSVGAWKTHYAADHAASFQKNTTIIKFPPQDTVHVRWYQKWSANWVWPSDQQKLIKLKGDGTSQNFPVTGNKNYIHLTYTPADVGVQAYVYSDWQGDTTAYRRGDSVDGNRNFSLQTNKWYCIEVMVNVNTLGQSDGAYRYWIDGDLKFALLDVEGRTQSGGVETIELQHVYQPGDTTVDMPTWMTGVAVATDRIGCYDATRGF